MRIAKLFTSVIAASLLLVGCDGGEVYSAFSAASEENNWGVIKSLEMVSFVIRDDDVLKTVKSECGGDRTTYVRVDNLDTGSIEEYYRDEEVWYSYSADIDTALVVDFSHDDVTAMLSSDLLGDLSRKLRKRETLQTVADEESYTVKFDADSVGGGEVVLTFDKQFWKYCGTVEWNDTVLQLDLMYYMSGAVDLLQAVVDLQEDLDVHD